MTDQDRLTWAGTRTQHEGFPLAIRARVGWIPPEERAAANRGDTPAGPFGLDHLAVLTHTFDPQHVKPNGFPKPRYNKRLSGFDAAAHDLLLSDPSRPDPRASTAPKWGAARYLAQKRKANRNKWADLASMPGLLVLVETFGGRRNYYAAVREPTHAETWAASVRDRFPTLDLTVECSPDHAARWFLRYAADFTIPLS